MEKPIILQMSRLKNIGKMLLGKKYHPIKFYLIPPEFYLISENILLFLLK